MTMSAIDLEARLQTVLRKRRRGADKDAALVPPHQPHPAPPNPVFRGG
jgi:hypothetical protein